MADKTPIITVDLNMFSQDAEAKTTAANKVAKSLGISDEALAKVEDFKRALTERHARLPLEPGHWYICELWGAVGGEKQPLAITSPIYTE